MNIQQVAQICHETNAAYCRSIGDASQKAWPDAQEWQRQSAIRGVRFALARPSAPASAQHDAWLTDKLADGWKFGPVKNASTKEHPCCVPYEDLPTEQKTKDYLFKAVVQAFAAQDNNFVIGSDGLAYGMDESAPG